MSDNESPSSTNTTPHDRLSSDCLAWYHEFELVAYGTPSADASYILKGHYRSRRFDVLD